MGDDADRDPKDPSPEQIRAMCAEIRARWPAHRWAQYNEQIEVETQLIKIDELSM